MRTMKLKLLFVCAAVLLLNVTPVAFGLVVGFNPDIHMDIQGVIANDFHVQGRLESGNWGGNWSNQPVLISHIDGGFPPANFKYSITPDLSDPCGQNWYNFTADWSGTNYPYCSIIHLGLFFDVTCNNVAVNLVGWWTKNGLPIVPPPVNGGAVPIPGFNVRDIPHLGMPQMISLFNQSRGGGGGSGGIETEIVQMDVVSLTKEELETYLGPIPAAFKELCVSGKQAELPWVQVENERGLISESNPQPLMPDSFFDVFLDVSGPIHPMTPVPIPPGGFLVARERVRFTNNNGLPEIRWDWMIHGAHESDLGDAPDSTNSFGMMPPLVLMTAYPKGGPAGVIAHYPTVYQIGSPPYGPIHWAAPLIAFLGPMVSSETEADIGPDQDVVNNIIPLKDTPDLDNFDDGVIFPIVLPHCQLATFDYWVNIMPPMPAPMPQTPTLYVNVWFDWNRDGDWDDTMECPGAAAPTPAPEWAVQNQVIVGLPVGLNKITTPPFMPWHPATGDMQPIWMRITLSEQKWAPTAGVLGNGGSGPQYGYLYGETEDYYFVPEVPLPQPKPLVEHSKWSQPPIEWNPQSRTSLLYCGWDAPSFKEEQGPALIWQIVADDFRCLGTMPITSIHWWGSYISWPGQNPPAVKPASWRIGFWSNVPPSPFGGISHPGKLLWQIEVPADRVKEEWVGSDQVPDMIPDTCFQYYVNLLPKEYFWQAKEEPNTVDSVFWLSIAAIYQPGLPPPNPWGWKTRPWHWMDDAVTFTIAGDFKPGYVPDPSTIRALEYCGQSYDTAFELDTDPNYIKWEQSYTGIRDWPHYEDEESMATVDTVVEPLTKWSQKPDLTPVISIDVDATFTQMPAYPPQVLADDFNCITTGPITDIYVWGSWLHDALPPGGPQNVIFTLSLHDDLPVGHPQNPNRYSMPGQLRWMRQFNPGDFEVLPYLTVPEGYYMPCTQMYLPQDHVGCWLYHFKLQPGEFTQTGTTTKPIIYWLDVQAMPIAATNPDIRFGWKASERHWNDDAVFAVGTEPIPVPGPWINLTYPVQHPYAGRTIDLAFEIVTQKQSEQFNLRRQVADDWRCQRRTPVTAAVWWGSYIGYRYEACQCQTTTPRPIKPDYFLLSIWTDVPANPGDPSPFSHPGVKKWEYRTNKYDEVLVGYDKHPEPGEPSTGGYEPVFRYSVKLSQTSWFLQEDVNNIYWFSVVAVYDQNDPTYPWGWTNHKHVFNDDAVAGHQDASGGWIWEELYDQTGESEDMSFVLFTEPECLIGGIAHAKEYADWVAWGKPLCWCYARQCRGDINGKKTGLYWVQLADLQVLAAAYNKTDAVLATIPNGICADLNHKKTGLYRVQLADLQELAKYYNKVEASVPKCDQAPLTTGPYNYWTKP